MAFAGNCGIEVDVPAPGVDGKKLGLESGLAAFSTCRPHLLIKNRVFSTSFP